MAETLARPIYTNELLGKLPSRGSELKDTKTYELSALEELRVDIDKPNAVVHLWMSKGQAEIYGAELFNNRIYTFLRGARFSIWSWTGCSIQIEGDAGSPYKTKESRVMTMHFNFHNCLEQYRAKAKDENLVGPRVLIVGSKNSGRSVLSRILLNYAARMREDDRRNPIFVDLDFEQPDLAVPGTLACCQFDRQSDPMFDYQYHRKFVLPYGYMDVETNPDLLHAQIRRMGDVIKRKFDNNSRARHSGVIINAFAWNKSHKYSHISIIVKAFKVNFIVVLDNERMFNELKDQTVDNLGNRDELERDLQVVLMPRARGLVESSQEERRLHRENRIRYNLYGHPLKMPRIPPYEHELDLADVMLCNLGNPHISKALLPENVDLVRIRIAAYPIPQKDVNYQLNHILYISNVDTADKVITEGSVIGYLLVKSANMAARKITVLTNFETVPKKVLVTSAIQFNPSPTSVS